MQSNMNLQKLFRISFLSLLVIGVLGTSSHCLMAFAENSDDDYHHHELGIYSDHNHDQDSESTKCCKSDNENGRAFSIQTSEYKLSIVSSGDLPFFLRLVSLGPSFLFLSDNLSQAPPGINQSLLAFNTTVRLLL